MAQLDWRGNRAVCANFVLGRPRPCSTVDAAGWTLCLPIDNPRIGAATEIGLAFVIVGKDRPGRWVVSCDHASNAVPEWVSGGDLGIAPQDMARHIAWDVGAAGLALALGEALDSPVFLSQFSRLVIDPNRDKDDPTLIMRLYDGTIIPGNRHIKPDDIAARVTRLYDPYHAALGALMARLQDTVLLAVHSFTPCLNGRQPRPWHVGVLYSHMGPQLSLPLLQALARDPDLCVGDNEPYAGHLPGDSIDQHALQSGRLNTLIEVRNDLIADARDQATWAARLAPHLWDALATAETA
jgi:predicted N-formylglutamate amidohydrolase